MVDYTTAAANGLRIGAYRGPNQVPYLPTGWKASRDGSLSGTRNEVPCEIVSPILRGADGLEQIATVLAALKTRGRRVNATCGFRVHVGFANRSEIRIDRLIKIVSYLETAIYATKQYCGENRRRGTYCKGFQQYGSVDAAKPRLKSDRYYVLNITNLGPYGRQPTIEIRAFSGSLNPVKVIGWALTVLGIVERGLTTRRTPRWKARPATGGWARDGVGQTDVERLFGFLGWGPGYQRLKGGHMYGWLSDIVPQTEIKKEFRRLAKKYDAEN